MKTKFLEIRSLSDPGSLEDSMFDLGRDGYELKETIPIFINNDRRRNVTGSGIYLARFTRSEGNRYVYLADQNQEIPKLDRGALASTLNERLKFFERAGFSCVSTTSDTKISGNPEFPTFGTDRIRMIFQKGIEPSQWEVFQKETDRLLVSEGMKAFIDDAARKLKLTKQKRPSWLDVKYDDYHASYMESWNEFLALLISKQKHVKINIDDFSREFAIALGVREGCDIEKTIFRMIVILHCFSSE